MNVRARRRVNGNGQTALGDDETDRPGDDDDDFGDDGSGIRRGLMHPEPTALLIWPSNIYAELLLRVVNALLDEDPWRGRVLAAAMVEITFEGTADESTWCTYLPSGREPGFHFRGARGGVFIVRDPVQGRGMESISFSLQDIWRSRRRERAAERELDRYMNPARPYWLEAFFAIRAEDEDDNAMPPARRVRVPGTFAQWRWRRASEEEAGVGFRSWVVRRYEVGPGLARWM